MSIHPWTHGEDMQFIQFRNTLQEIHSSRSDLCMIPHRVTRQLKMMDILWIFNGEKYYVMVNKTLHCTCITSYMWFPCKMHANVFIVVFSFECQVVHAFFSCFSNHWRRGNTLEMSGFPSSCFNAYFDKTLNFIRCKTPFTCMRPYNNNKATTTTS